MTFNGESLPAQPLMWIHVFHEPSTDTQLAPYKMTRQDWEKDHQAQLATTIAAEGLSGWQSSAEKI